MENILSKEFLEEIIGGEIHEYTCSAGSKPGDNYTSVLIGLDVVLKKSDEKVKHLLIKIFPKSVEQRKYLVESQIFMKEIQVYSIWFQELGKIIHGSGLKLPFPPYVNGRALKSMPINDSLIHDLDNYLLMVDIRKTFGFQMSPTRLLDYDHCVQLVEKMAQVHSLSHIYKVKNGLEKSKLVSKFPFLKENLCIEESRGIYQSFMDKNLAKFLKTLEVTYGLDSDIYKSYNKLKERDLFTQVLAFCQDRVDLEKLETFLRIRSFKSEEIANSEPWSVCCHSDSWGNNLLFHYDNAGKPDDLMFVDFQFMSEQCPTLDLSFFFYMSTELKIREKIPQFLKIYHDKFLQILQQFSTPYPGGEDFENFDHFIKRFRTARYFGFLTAMLWYGIVLESIENSVGTEKGGSEEIFAFDSVKSENLENVEPLKGFVGNWLMELAQELYQDGIV